MPSHLPEAFLWAAVVVALVAVLMLVRDRISVWPAGLPLPDAHVRPSGTRLREDSENWDVPETADGDRRDRTRRTGNPVPVHLLATEKATPWTVMVLDRSSRGLQLGAENPLPVGVVVRLRPRDAATDTPWTEAAVRWCAPDKDRWLMGCQFTGDVSWNVLLQFG